MIVNNVAGMAGGGISIKDGLNVSIVNNTIMNNDSTATAYNAFSGCPEGVSPSRSCPKPAGIVSYAHSNSLLTMALEQGASIGTFSNPTMINNIVLGNRSQYWQITDGIGELFVEPGPSDFGILGTTGALSTSNSIFTSGNDAGGLILGGLVGSGGTNREVDGDIPFGVGPCPSLTGQCSIVNNPYHNSPPDFVDVQPDGTVVPAGEFPAVAEIALDEGGNSIDVHFGPLSPVGDYHLQLDGPNIAENNGATPNAGLYPGAWIDFDREARPRGTPPMFDIGADEIPGGEFDTGGPDLMYFSTRGVFAVGGLAIRTTPTSTPGMG